jgi:hypothetical protein
VLKNCVKTEGRYIKVLKSRVKFEDNHIKKGKKVRQFLICSATRGVKNFWAILKNLPFLIFIYIWKGGEYNDQ